MENSNTSDVVSAIYLVVTVGGFILTWGVTLAMAIYNKGKQNEHINGTFRVLKQEIDVNKKEVDKTIKSVSEDIIIIKSTFLDGDGDPKFLTKKEHSVQCLDSQRIIAAEQTRIRSDFAEIKGDIKSLLEVKGAVDSIQDTLLEIVTTSNK